MFLRWVLPITVFSVVGPPTGLLIISLFFGTGISLNFALFAVVVSYAMGLMPALTAGISFAALSWAYESFASTTRTSEILGVAFGSIAGCIGVLFKNWDLGVAVIPTTAGALQICLLGVLAGSVCGFICVHFQEKAVARNEHQGA